MFFAMWRAAYAAERSTFVGSLPENAPPPCGGKLILFIDTMGTGVVSDDQLAAAVDKLFDLRPNAIIQRLNLRRPIYRANCNYGHFGKADMPWEQLDYVNALRREILE